MKCFLIEKKTFKLKMNLLTQYKFERINSEIMNKRSRHQK